MVVVELRQKVRRLDRMALGNVRGGLGVDADHGWVFALFVPEVVYVEQVFSCRG